MSTATITLSSKGQIVIPKEIRDELRWQAGTRLTLVASASGITLKSQPSKGGRKLIDLIGILRKDGPVLSTADLCAPVDYAGDGVDDAQSQR